MQRFLVALLTVAVFAAGFGARVWTEKAPAVPEPPTVVGGEFNSKSSEAPRGGTFRMMTRTQMIEAIEQNLKQIDVYRTRVDELDKEFEIKFVAILTDAQKQAFADEQKRQNDLISRMKASAGSKEVLTDDQIDRLRNNPLQNVLRMIQPKERAERLTGIYHLTAEQHTQVVGFLNVRRDGFLRLVDETPNPSVRYSDLAQIVDRLANPEILKQEAADKQERQEKTERGKKVEPEKK